MLSRPNIVVIAELAGRCRLPIVYLAGMIFLMSAGLELKAQDNAGSADPAAIKIEVLDVTTGSGSQAVNSGPKVAEPVAASPAQNGDKNVTPPSAAAAVPAKEPADAKREALFAALERWHYDTLTSYNYNIDILADPFMPISEVRGQPPVIVDPAEEAKLPPLLRLELNQVKLVAITSLPGRQQASIVSFEDSAGSSYILRLGDRIGRNHGRITKINTNEVWVEERGRSGNDAPKTSVLRLNSLDTQGMTRSAVNDGSGSLQTLSVPGE